MNKEGSMVPRENTSSIIEAENTDPIGREPEQAEILEVENPMTTIVLYSRMINTS